MSFIAAVTSTDDEAVDALFGVKTPGADNLLGGEDKEGKEPKDQKKPDPKTGNPAEPKETAQEKVNKLDANEVIDGLFPGDKEPDGKGSEPKEGAEGTIKKPIVEKTKVPAVDSEVDYEAVYNQMVKDGVWEEVDLPENTPWNADTFKKVQQLQTTTQYQDLLDKTGPVGKKIIQFEKDGGNPTELLDLFREQREVREFDIKEPEGQEEFMRAFYESQGNSEKSIERMIKALQDQGPEAFKEESEEKKALWDNQYNQEIEARSKQQALIAKEMEDGAKVFQKTINDALTSDEEVTPKERKDLREYILSYNQAYRGRKGVSQFYVDMAEIQKDPTSYIELAKFIKGIKTGDYKKKIESKAKKEVSAQTFMKIKNGAALKPSGGVEANMSDGSESNFITLLKNKK